MRSKQCIILPRVHKACIYSKNNILMQKVHKTCIYSKNKDIKNLRLYVGLTGIGELFFFLILVEYMQVWWLFTIKTFDFFWVYAGLRDLRRLYASQSHIESEIFCFFKYMQVWWLFTIKTFDFFWVYAGLSDLKRLYASQSRIESEIFCFFEYMRVLPLLAPKWWSFLSICRFGEPQVSQTYSTCLQPRNKNAE